MNAYIDFQNFCSYLKSSNNQDFKSCDNVLVHNFDLYFTFGKNKLSMAKKEVRQLFDIWQRTATKNRNGKKIVWEVSVPRPITDNDISNYSLDELSSIYLLDGEDAISMSKHGSLLIANIGDELATIKKLQIDSQFIPTKQYRIRKMKTWNKYGVNSCPCTDVIIVDPYIFAQSDYEYEVNSYELLKQLTRNVKNEKVNIVIFTFKDYKTGKQVTAIPFNIIQRSIKEILNESIGIEPNVTFVMLPAFEQHDRTILTNYKMFTSGDSFKYFKDGKNISLGSHGEWMHISSLYDTDIYDDTRDFINDIQVIIDDVKDGLMNIIGDKKSNFLCF